MLHFGRFREGPGPGAERAVPSRLATSQRTHSGEKNCDASNSAQHVVSKGNARSLRVHDYRGAQGGKKLAKLSVRHKRNSKRGHSLPCLK